MPTSCRLFSCQRRETNHGSVLLTFIAGHDSFQDVSDLTSRIEIRDYVDNQLELIQHDQEGKCSPFRSVDTPVANRPREATANEPPKSTELQSQL